MADYLTEVGEAGKELGGMDEFALSVGAALGGLKEVRDKLELIQEQLETAREIAERGIPSKSA